MKTAISLGAVILIATTVNPSYAQNKILAQPVECYSLDVATTEKTPFDYWRSIPTCVAEEKYDQAVFMFGLAGSLGAFDSMRVTDPSARQAAKLLPMLGMSAMGKEKSVNFQKAVQAHFGDDAKRSEMCAKLIRMSPPSYFPSYMVNHGLANMAGNKSAPLASDFNADDAWQKSVISYLKCPNG